MELSQLVQDFAAGMVAADARSPQAFSRRDQTRRYQHGIGPFPEDEAVALTVREMQPLNPNTQRLRSVATQPPQRCAISP